MKLSPKYYKNNDVLFLGKDLLGKILATKQGRGIIIETESYKAPEDKASHAYNMRRTQRNEVMYSQGGKAYVYLCYGMHHLFNVVTGEENMPHAILVRGILPLPQATIPIFGPGRVSTYLNITRQMNGCSLTSETIWIEKGIEIPQQTIECLPRIGIDYAAEYAHKPWRFSMPSSFLKNFTELAKFDITVKN